jgi:hypothetical protein
MLCCLIFIAFIAGCVVVTGLGFNQGDPNLVLYPYDEDTRQCGRGNFTDYPYLYFYKAVSNFQSINTTGIVNGVCVSSCPGNYTGKLNCTATKANPSCSVDYLNFYVSTPCKQNIFNGSLISFFK